MATITTTGSGNWSSATPDAPWPGGTLPTTGDKVNIASGHTVTQDGTHATGDGTTTSINIKSGGILKASRTATSQLTYTGKLVVESGGELDFGKSTDAIPAAYTATLILNQATVNYEGLNCNAGGKAYFYGESTRTRKTTLTATANAAQAVLACTDVTGWANGDLVAVFHCKTSGTSNNETEIMTISSIAGNNVTLTGNLTYAHLAGATIANLYANVIVKSGSTTYPNKTNFAWANATADGSINFGWAKFQDLGYAANGGAIQLSANGDVTSVSKQAVTGMTGMVFYRQSGGDATSATQIYCASNRGPIPVTNTVFVGRSGSDYAVSNIKLLEMSDCAASIAYMLTSTSGVIGNASISNSVVCIQGQYLCNAATSSGIDLTNVTVYGRGVAMLGENPHNITATDCDFGNTYGWDSIFGNEFFRASDVGAKMDLVLTDCSFESGLDDLHTTTSKEQIGGMYAHVINIGGDVTQQKLFREFALLSRDNSTMKGSTSSLSIKPITTVKDTFRDIKVPVAAGAAVKVRGYLQYDSSFYNAGTWTAPTVQLIEEDGTTVAETFTAAGADAGNWQAFELDGTGGAADGVFTVRITVNANAVTTGTVYVSALPDAPFITKARHYGYLFNETNPAVTANPTTSANEATAAAYTGMTITWGASSSSVSITASNTFQKLYDYSQAQACLNVASALPLTGAGVAGNASLFAAGAVTVSDGAVLNGAGSISMGSHLLSTEFSGGVNYTYTGGTWSQLTTVPTFNGGTLNLGAAGTYTFTSAAGMIWSMTPTAPGTYATGGCTLTGQQDLRNTSGTHAITVELPSGASYTTANNTGAAITVSTPQVYQEVTISGATAGSRLQIYDTTSSTELYNGTPTFPYTWTDGSPAAADRAIRIRVSYVSGATAKNFIEANIGTCGQTSGTESVSYLVSQSADTTYDANAIDGSTVTGITIDDSIDRVKINIAGGSVSWPSIYAYQVYWLSTSAGIIDDGAFIEAVDTANYLLTGFDIRNINANPLTITGGWGRDSTTLTIAGCIDAAGSTGNIYPMPDHVVAYATGSALTAGQAAELSGIKAKTDSLGFTVSGKVDANIQYVNDLVVDGAGTEANPWGPA